MRNIRVAFIPSDQMRYPTCDDYQIDPDGVLNITIAETGNDKSNLAMLVHALVEQFVAEQDGVTIEQIDTWDFSYPLAMEPGELPGCPYARAHHAAMFAERATCAALGLNWDDHNESLERAIEEKLDE